MSPERTKQNIFKALLYLFLIILAVLCLVPFWMMLVNSTRSGNEIMTSFSKSSAPPATARAASKIYGARYPHLSGARSSIVSEAIFAASGKV